MSLIFFIQLVLLIAVIFFFRQIQKTYFSNEKYDARTGYLTTTDNENLETKVIEWSPADPEEKKAFEEGKEYAKKLNKR